ncbi:hypothetical protein [Streptomyces sp. NEAU-W12]|uniref:hypothetical protein n=1 Tax=Streptomyces sp. NEAU-W12 TaxID=2994668 RepID=UPI00224AA8DF|nr:hypothetical protein [Streptomyces sp. NEAU-W12]MCX2924121.1 hypothetical protein [Streptomyces sp. NEAU-W12]
MVLLRPVLLPALILFGAGFALGAVRWIAVLVLVVWVLGFVVRPAGPLLPSVGDQARDGVTRWGRGP